MVDSIINGIINACLVLVGILISMTLHELMHGFVAYKLGDDTAKNEGRLTLNPLKHLDLVYSIIVPLIMFLAGGTVFGGAKPVPVNSRNLKGGEWGMALVALAGPVTNIILAFLGFIVIEIVRPNFGELFDIAMSNFVFTNLGFAVFNMIPLPPLDGSRILYAIAPDSIRLIMEKIESTLGVWLIYGLIFLFSGVFSTVISGGVQGILEFFYWIFGR